MPLAGMKSLYMSIITNCLPEIRISVTFKCKYLHQVIILSKSYTEIKSSFLSLCQNYIRLLKN